VQHGVIKDEEILKINFLKLENIFAVLSEKLA